jgi:hypothetical protein
VLPPESTTMTLEQLQRSLPNGLHDAVLTGLRVDYVTRSAVLEIDIDVSPASDVSAAVSCRPARIVFSGLQFVVIDPPGPAYDGFAPSTIDAGEGQPSTYRCELPPLKGDAFLCWIFVSRLNAFIRIAAEDVELEWQARVDENTTSW